MSYILVIVESPGKIKKLEQLMGSNYKVTSSCGHIIDLHPNKFSVDIENNFEPEYHIITGKYQNKKKTVSDLQLLSQSASKIIIASDDDREGEEQEFNTLDEPVRETIVSVCISTHTLLAQVIVLYTYVVYL